MRIPLLILTLISTVAFAGGEVSGGGSGVARPSAAAPTEVQSLELYRAYKNPSYQLSPKIRELIEKSAKPKTDLERDNLADRILQSVYEELGRVSGPLLKRLSDAESQMGRFVEGESPLEKIADHGDITLNANEEIVQVLRRENDKAKFDPKLWPLVEAQDRAAFKLHEALHALSSHPTTVQTQQLVALLMSEELTRMSPEEFSKEVLPQLGFEFQSLEKKDLAFRDGAHLVEEARYINSKDMMRGGGMMGLVMGMALGTISEHEAGDDIPYGAKVEGETCGILKDYDHKRRRAKMMYLVPSRKGLFDPKDKTLSFAERDWTKIFYHLDLAKTYFKAVYPESFYPTGSMLVPYVCVKKQGWGKVAPTYVEARYSYEPYESGHILSDIHWRMDRIRKDREIEEMKANMAKWEAELRKTHDFDERNRLLYKVSDANLKLLYMEEARNDRQFANDLYVKPVSDIKVLDRLRIEF